MKYYSTCRPLSVGIFPVKKNMEIVNFDTPKFIPEIERNVWGYVETDKMENYKEYDLIPEMRVYMVAYRLLPNKPPIHRMVFINVDSIPKDELTDKVCRKYFQSQEEAQYFIDELVRGN